MSVKNELVETFFQFRIRNAMHEGQKIYHDCYRISVFIRKKVVGKIVVDKDDSRIWGY